MRGFWVDKNGIKNKYSYLSEDIACDICIIGGGIAGAINAYVLSKEGFNVVVIDKNIAGYKNSSISSGCMTDFIDDLYIKADENVVRKYSELKSKARNIFNLMIKEVDTRYKVADYMITDNRFLQKRNFVKEAKCRNEFLEKCEFQKRMEDINLGNIVKIERGAYLLDTYMLTRDIFKYLSKNNNFKIYENTCVKELEYLLHEVYIYTQNNFKIKAKSVIFTTPTECLDFVIGNSNIEVVKRFSVVSKSKNKENLCLKVINEIPLYIRNTSDFSIVSGMDMKYMSKMENDRYLENLMDENKRKMESAVAKILPSLDFKDSQIYCANVLKTNDLLPIISEIDEIPNVYLNIGSGSSSIMQTIVGANMLKDVIEGYYPREMNMFKLKRQKNF